MALYEDVAAKLRERLISGEFSIGDPFVGIYDVRVQYDVSDGTAHRALGLLDAAGEIEMRQGHRSIVRKIPTNDINVMDELRTAVAAINRVLNHLAPPAARQG